MAPSPVQGILRKGERRAVGRPAFNVCSAARASWLVSTWPSHRYVDWINVICAQVISPSSTRRRLCCSIKPEGPVITTSTTSCASAARLGHADPAITLRVYAHVLRDQASAVAQVFASVVDSEHGANPRVSKSVSKNRGPRPTPEGAGRRDLR